MPDTLNILNILVTKLEAVREDLSHPLEETLSGRMDVIKPKHKPKAGSQLKRESQFIILSVQKFLFV